MRRLRVALLTLGVAAVAVVVPFLAAPAFAATGPSASDLLNKVKTCSSPSKGKYATDDGESSPASICKSGSASFWKADMDIGGDGVSTSHCNSSADPWYQNETSFETSKGKP